MIIAQNDFKIFQESFGDNHWALFEMHNAEDPTPETYHLDALGTIGDGSLPIMLHNFQGNLTILILRAYISVEIPNMFCEIPALFPLSDSE